MLAILIVLLCGAIAYKPTWLSWDTGEYENGKPVIGFTRGKLYQVVYVLLHAQPEYHLHIVPFWRVPYEQMEYRPSDEVKFKREEN